MNKKIVYFTCTNAYPKISGVWTRVYNEAKKYQEKGCYVHVLTVGDGEWDAYEYDGIKITKYGTIYKISENVRIWKDFSWEVEIQNPDIIECQSYRHPETNAIAKMKRKGKITSKIYLTCHGSESKRDRGFIKNILIWIYDKLFSKKILNSFDKIYYIEPSQKERLLKLGAEESKLEYSPNKVSKEFKEIPIKKPVTNDILYLGRITPFKNIESAIYALRNINVNVRLHLVGECESWYWDHLKRWAIFHGVLARIVPPSIVYDTKEKIELIDKHRFFILPSKVECSPFSIKEAEARKRFIITESDPDEIAEIINKELKNENN